MKAILVIDMPESCHDCTLIYPDKYKDIWCCTACDWVVEENVTAGTLYKGCPLKPMPPHLPSAEIIKVMSMQQGINLPRPLYTEEYQKGYNDCISEISGEEE